MPIESNKYIDFKNGSYICVSSEQHMKELVDRVYEALGIDKVIENNLRKAALYGYWGTETIKPWTVKDPGLGYKDYMCKYEGEWKGEQKMGTMCTECFGGAKVNGKLYYRDVDGNFVELMTVTNIEETTDIFGDGNSRAEIKVDGYAPWKSEKVDVNRIILGTMREKWQPEDHIYFMTFDDTTFSVKIHRTRIGRVPDYSWPYSVTVYDARDIIRTNRYQTWRDLECSFLYDIGEALNAIFSPISMTPPKVSKMLQNAEKVVAYHEWTKAMIKDTINRTYGLAVADTEFPFVGGYTRTDLPTAANIEKVIFDNPATVILWKDGTRTVVHTQNGERYDKEKGFAMAVCKKIFGNERDYYYVFKRWFRKGEDRSKKEEKE